MFYDSSFLLLIPAILLSIYAQIKVSRTFSKYSKISNKRGISGKEIAETMLRSEGIQDVSIKQATGFLSDHYNPLKKELRLSPDVYGGSSIASVGVAAHEGGHAIQHARSYYPMHLRTFIYPAVSFSSWMAPILIILGFIINNLGMLKFGIVFYALSVVFTLITLPVEFNASSRALAFIKTHSILDSQEFDGTSKVLKAAALTYVAAAITAILEL